MDQILKHINTFSGGLNRDTNPTHVKPDEYYDANNIRFIIDEDGSSGCITNINGGVKKLTFPSNEVIKGICFIRNRMIIFTVDIEQSNTFIYSFIDDGSINEQTLDDTMTTDIDSTPHFKLFYTDSLFSNSLGFTISDEIIVYGRYETDNIEKIYFCTENTPLKIINIKSGNAVLKLLNPDLINVLPVLNNCNYNFIQYTNGNLKSGVRHYCIQYYNKFLTETEVTPLSFPIHLSESLTNVYTTTIKGNKIGTNTGLGIKLKIYNLDIRYDFIKVIAIHYNDIISDPEVNVVYDGNFDKTLDLTYGAFLNIVDTGQIISSLSISDITFGNKLELSPKTIESKDNYLFLANNKISDYDLNFDTRAYRFRMIDNTAKIFDTNGDYYVILGSDKSWIKYNSNNVQIGSGNNWITIPSTADCIIDKNSIDEYIYVANPFPLTNTISYQGAEGPNIKITIGEELIPLIDNKSLTSELKLSTVSNDWTIGEKRLFQRGEIYRFALNIKNTKGQNAYAKWICDFKMPSYWELSATGSYSYLYNIGDNVNSVRFYPKINITNLSNGLSVQALYHKRDEVNRTILAQGIISPLSLHDNKLKGMQFYSRTPNSAGSTYTYEFNSPEPIINNKFISNTNDKIQPLSSIDGIWKQTDISNLGNDHRYETLFYNYANSDVTNITTTQIDVKKASFNKLNLTTQYTLSSNVTESDYPVEMSIVAADGAILSRHGSTLYFSTLTQIPRLANALAEHDRGTLINYLKSADGIYGGNSYTSRQVNQNYIVASDCTINNYSGTTLNCFYGDTFLNYFVYLRGIYAHFDDSNIVEMGDGQFIDYIPVESTINTTFMTNPQMINLLTTNNSLCQREDPCIVISDIDKATIYTQDYYLYEYNSVYSRVQDTQKYITKPSTFVSENTFDTRIYHSEKKFNGETLDSWGIFKPLNRLDVDSSYGKIVRLINHNNLLIFFQPTGAGILSINQRSLLNDNNISTLVLGTGGVLERYDMISTNYGCSSYNAICNSDTTIYFYDDVNKKLMRYTNNEEELSVVGKVNSIFRNFTGNIVLTYNQKYKEVFINLIGNLENETGYKILVYSEYLNNFLGFFGFYSDLFESYGNKLYLRNSIATENEELYLFDVEQSDYKMFNSIVLSSPFIEIISTNGLEQAIWDNTSFNLFFKPKYEQSFTAGSLTVSSGNKVLIYDHTISSFENKIYKNITAGNLTLTNTTDLTDVTKWNLVSDIYGNYLGTSNSITIDYRNSYQSVTNKTTIKKYREHNSSIGKDIKNTRLIDNILFTKLKFLNPNGNYTKFKLQEISTFFRKLIKIR